VILLGPPRRGDHLAGEIRNDHAIRLAHQMAAMNPVSASPADSSSTVSPGCGSSYRVIHSLTG
jgi:hypothetical protein